MSQCNKIHFPSRHFQINSPNEMSQCKQRFWTTDIGCFHEQYKITFKVLCVCILSTFSV